MATITQNVITVLEQAKRTFNGDIIGIAEVLDDVNELISTAAAYEANDTFSHVVSIRDALPTISPRAVNEGASSTVSKVRQKRENMMVLDSIVEIDELLLRHEPNMRQALMQEIRAHLEGTAQQFSHEVIYGDESDDPKTIDGFATRYASPSLANVQDAGGSGSDCTSLWMVEWGKDTAHLIYPKGSMAGISEDDMGWRIGRDGSSNPYKVYTYQVMAEFGLSVSDDRAAQRIGSIESTGTSNNLVASNGMHPLVYAKNALPRMGKNARIYVNRDLKSQFDIWALDKDNMYFTMETLQDGSVVTRFQGIPISMLEAITSTEDAI